MKLSERMRNMSLSWVAPYEQKDFDLIDEVAKLEADLERHEGQIRHYPDSYLGKIFFQGVECGIKQAEAKEK